MLHLNTKGLKEDPNICDPPIVLLHRLSIWKKLDEKENLENSHLCKPLLDSQHSRLSAQQDKHCGLGNPRAAADCKELLTRIHISCNDVFV